MNQVQSQTHAQARAPRVGYRPLADAGQLLTQPGTLAVFGFNAALVEENDPRFLNVPLGQPDAEQPAMLEYWHSDATIRHGREGALQWASAGEDWLFTALTLDEREHGGPERTAEHAYASLCRFLDQRPQCHVQRLWNYLADINSGSGDAERYKHFCAGRLLGMGDFFAHGFPAATAVGHRDSTPLLQVYCLSATQAGTRIENPRQLSAWRYPRQYGPTPPSFARAMRLSGETSLAISGTASITGHQSQHEGDLQPQLRETLDNLHALLRSNGLPENFGPDDPLKVYLRHAEHADAVRAFINRHLPEAPHILLLGDVCRSELLVEIDGWRWGE